MTPTALTVDHVSGRIFWIDIEAQKIEQSDFRGQNRVVLLQLPNKNGRWGLKYLNSNLYWTNPSKESVESFDLVSRSSRTLVTGLTRTSYDLAVQSASLGEGNMCCVILLLIFVYVCVIIFLLLLIF